MNIVKRLYDWMLSWGNSRWGGFALFLFALAESSFFPIPPDVLLIALCLGVTTRSFRYGAICLSGSIVGAMIGYAIGFFCWQNTAGEYTALANWFFAHVFSLASFFSVGEVYDKYNFLSLPQALLPCPIRFLPSREVCSISTLRCLSLHLSSRVAFDSCLSLRLYGSSVRLLRPLLTSTSISWQ